MINFDEKMNENHKNSEEYKRVPINYNLRPKYYDDFRCKAQNCRVTCCMGWDITMSRKDYLKMRSQQASKELNQKIKQALHKIKNGQGEDFYAKIRCHENNCCPLYTEEGLCELQIKCGVEALPKVCNIFPRYEKYSCSGYLEQFLTLGCEAVLELLWDLPEGIDFVSDELSQEQKTTGRYSMYSPNLYFQEIRSLCIDLLQDRRFPVRQRILLMGVFLQQLPFDVTKVPQWCIETNVVIQSSDLLELSKILYQTKEEITQKYIFQNIQTLIHPSLCSSNPKLKEYYKQFLNQFFFSAEPKEENRIWIAKKIAYYQHCKERFTKTFGDIEYFFENIMVSLFFFQELPILSSKEDMWKKYVSFCNLYSITRFVAITSCTADVDNPKEQLIEAILFIMREILHKKETIQKLQDLFFENDSATLANMAILLRE